MEARRKFSSPGQGDLTRGWAEVNELVSVGYEEVSLILVGGGGEEFGFDGEGSGCVLEDVSGIYHANGELAGGAGGDGEVFAADLEGRGDGIALLGIGKVAEGGRGDEALGELVVEIDGGLGVVEVVVGGRLDIHEGVGDVGAEELLVEAGAGVEDVQGNVSGREEGIAVVDAAWRK
jgi:hypothetical protein